MKYFVNVRSHKVISIEIIIEALRVDKVRKKCEN